MNSVITIPALGDNFIYLYRYNQSDALAVDPCDSSLVLRALKEHGLNLKAILITHHHWDHVGGTNELKRKTGCEVIGADKRRIPGIDLVVTDEQVLSVSERKIRVIATPGHTSTSVCYYMEPLAGNENGILWTGDTLFVGGCGRLLEQDAQSMWDSLQKLASLPDDTLVYCGHDYTLENYEFASGIEPGNQIVKERLDQIRQLLTQGKLTVPSSILLEKSTNCFLRAGTPELKTALGMPDAQAVEVFAELRRRKDVF
ncbi:MAG: hydroxyacylglutathione hydrolase [Planctomycetota bacterium]|jgi:hydroxyacylglutathione hydrolase